MNAFEHNSSTEHDTTIEKSTSSPWVANFLEQLNVRAHGDNLSRLIEPKLNVRQTVIDFAGDILPDEAIDIAEIAHLGELVRHETLGKNIQRSLGSALYMNHELTDEQSRYTGALISDLAELGAYAKTAHGAGEESPNLKLLAEKINSINIESVILKSALDYSNFMLLEEKSELSTKEARKMERIISSTRHIDSVLLETLGFDALAAEMLDKIFRYELESEGNGRYVNEAKQLFENLGGRDTLGVAAQDFLNELFHEDNSLHYQVTANQTDYGMHFTDGEVTLPDSHESFRTLSRLKGIGQAAKKMCNLHNKHGAYDVPADIIGTTFIAKDVAGIKTILQHVMQRLEQMGVDFVNAPGRVEQVHIKGQQATFIDEFTHIDSPIPDGLSIDPQVCDNGYEAVKLTIRYNGLPIEMQFTHEASREASRSGLASHTLFKLFKLFGINAESSFTKEEIATFLSQLNSLKRELSKDNLSIVPESKARAEALERSVAREIMLATHYSAAERLGILASQKYALVV